MKQYTNTLQRPVKKQKLWKKMTEDEPDVNVTNVISENAMAKCRERGDIDAIVNIVQDRKMNPIPRTMKMMIE